MAINYLRSGVIARFSAIMESVMKHAEKTLAGLNKNGQILFRYCNKNREITPESNPSGAIENIAGICNPTKNVLVYASS